MGAHRQAVGCPSGSVTGARTLHVLSAGAAKALVLRLADELRRNGGCDDRRDFRCGRRHSRTLRRGRSLRCPDTPGRDAGRARCERPRRRRIDRIAWSRSDRHRRARRRARADDRRFGCVACQPSSAPRRSTARIRSARRRASISCACCGKWAFTIALHRSCAHMPTAQRAMAALAADGGGGDRLHAGHRNSLHARCPARGLAARAFRIDDDLHGRRRQGAPPMRRLRCSSLRG